MAVVIAVGGCADVDVGPGAGWFTKSADFFGKSGGFNFQEFRDASQQRPVTANDLVDANGACPAVAAAAPPTPPPAPPPSPPQQSPDGAGGPPAPDALLPPSLLGGGIGLGMTECDVVQRAGAAEAVTLGNTPRGERSVMLTYNSGPRPGIYRFTSGRLVDIERVAAPPPPPEAAKKKKPAKPRTARNDNT
jgi:hypothetical protein